MTPSEIDTLRSQISGVLKGKASCWCLAVWNPGQPGDYFSSQTVDVKEQSIRLLACIYDLLNSALLDSTPQQLIAKTVILTDIRKLICQLYYYTEVTPSTLM